MSVNVKADDLLKYTAQKMKITDDTLANVGAYINADQPDTRMSVAKITSFSLNIPEDGCYVVTLTNEWGVDAETAFSVLYLEYDGEIVAFSRNSMRAGGGQCVTAIVQATKGSSVKGNMSWHGGSGNAEASRIKFRAVRVGGGNRLKRIFSRLRRAVRI